MNIISIGGGSLRKRETLPIDRAIVRLTGKRSPRALFIPTASMDDLLYCDQFEQVYGGLLGCRTDYLLLYRNPAGRKEAARQIEAADLVYVGGGNTLRMMRMWRRLGVDRLLKKAAQAGTVLAGLSAGAICWHEWGHSDSRAFSGGPDWDYIKVRALGIVPGLFCPHLDGEKRHASFMEMVVREEMTGIACDNHAAIHYGEDGARCIAAKSAARVHVYRAADGVVGVTSYRNGAKIGLPRENYYRPAR